MEEQRIQMSGQSGPAFEVTPRSSLLPLSDPIQDGNSSRLSEGSSECRYMLYLVHQTVDQLVLSKGGGHDTMFKVQDADWILKPLNGTVLCRINESVDLGVGEGKRRSMISVITSTGRVEFRVIMFILRLRVILVNNDQ